jgi:hypothetical protein
MHKKAEEAVNMLKDTGFRNADIAVIFSDDKGWSKIVS